MNFSVAPTAIEFVSIKATTHYAMSFTLLVESLLLVSGGAVLAFKRSRS